MSRNKFIVSLLCLVLILPLLLSGCKSKDEKSYVMYFLNIDKNALVTVDYSPEAKTTDGLINEFIKELSKEQDSTEYVKTIPANVTLRDYELDNKELILDFSYQYNDMDTIKEVLVRSAISKTLLQIDGIDSISFYVSGEPLVDSSGRVIGSMTSSSFMDYNSSQKEDLEKKTLTLYYASEDGNYLIKEKKTVYYDKSILAEKVVLENLQKDPKSEGAQVALPKNAKIKSVTVSEGICYVTLDASLLSQMNDVSRDVLIYSIVDSLCELDNISKVSIAVENNPVDLLGQSFSIDGIYESNDNLVK